MRATPTLMFSALLLAAWLTAAGACSSSSTGADAAAVTTGAAGKGSAGGRAGTSGGGSGGTAGTGCGGLCQPGQTCCYDRSGKLQCLPPGAVCTG